LRPIRRFTAIEGVLRVGDRLALGRLAHQHFVVFVNATIDGVVRSPSLFSMTLGLPPSMTATHELVVPRSMPITFRHTVLLKGKLNTVGSLDGDAYRVLKRPARARR
jgi:hypothetical protein